MPPLCVQYLPDDVPPLRPWMQILDRPCIVERIFLYLTAGDIVRMGRTCSAGRLAVQIFRNDHFSINRHLSRFFRHPLAFRSLQAATGTLISGSSALQFLNRTFYAKSDLDLYTHPGYAKQVGRWLIDVEAYQYLPKSSADIQSFENVACVEWSPSYHASADPSMTHNDDDEEEYYYSGLHDVYFFQKTNATGERLRIQIMSAQNTPLQCILRFHSSTSCRDPFILALTIEGGPLACVMNFITFNAAYSLYPKATFDHTLNLALRNDCYNDQRCLAKYAHRGWRTIGNFWPQDNTTAQLFALDQDRFVGDSICWTILLDLEGVQNRPRLSSTSDAFDWDPAERNSWSLATTSAYPWRASTTFSFAKSPVFRFTYLCANEPLRFALTSFGRKQGVLQWKRVKRRKLKLGSRTDWTWYDSLVPDIIAGFPPHNA